MVVRAEVIDLVEVLYHLQEYDQFLLKFDNSILLSESA